jgi:hypothetical protein
LNVVIAVTPHPKQVLASGTGSFYYPSKTGRAIGNFSAKITPQLNKLPINSKNDMTMLLYGRVARTKVKSEMGRSGKPAYNLRAIW